MIGRNLLNVYFVVALGWLVNIHLVEASDLNLNVETDRSEISEDESISLKFTVTFNKNSNDSGSIEPEFSAPDFQIINRFSSSHTEAVLENGKFEVKNTRGQSIVLRPKKTGRLEISGIKLSMGGETVTHPTIYIEVKNAGSTAPPSKKFGGVAGAGSALDSSDRRPFFITAELNKEVAYKGEQIIVSYYIYKQAQIGDIQIQKYPVLEGFLREDLQIPALRRDLDWRRIHKDGRIFDKALLARYAAYPLKSGKLLIDSISIKATYYLEHRGNSPFGEDRIFSFFNRARSGTESSKRVSLEVSDLPQEGRPQDFNGTVGEFSITGSLDQQSVEVGKPVNLSIKVEGRGNLSSLKFPSVNWPDGIRVFESNSDVKNAQSDIAEKAFDVVLIPTKPGDVILPNIEFPVFNPAKKEYENLSISGLSFTSFGNPLPIAKSVSGVKSVEKEGGQAAAVMPDLSDFSRTSGFDLARIYSERLTYFFAGVLGLLVLFLTVKARMPGQKKRKASTISEIWLESQKRMERIFKTSPFDLDAATLEIERALYGSLEVRMGEKVYSVSREDWKSSSQIDRCSSILDKIDQIRFSREQSSAVVLPEKGEIEKLYEDAKKAAMSTVNNAEN